jgi:hypothetical protein
VEELLRAGRENHIEDGGNQRCAGDVDPPGETQRRKDEEESQEPEEAQAPPLRRRRKPG